MKSDIDNVFIKIGYNKDNDYYNEYQKLGILINIDKLNYINNYKLFFKISINNYNKDFDGIINLIIINKYNYNEYFNITIDGHFEGSYESYFISNFKLIKVIEDTPKLIHQIKFNNKITQNDYLIISSCSNMNPTYTCRYWTFDQCYELIKLFFNKKVLDALDLLYANEHKINLLSLCILYIYGGTFIDNKIICEYPLENIEEDLLICKDFSGFIQCKPKNIIIGYILYFIVERILNYNSFNDKFLFLNCNDGMTGHIVFKLALNLYLKKNINAELINNDNLKIIELCKNKIIHNNKIIISIYDKDIDTIINSSDLFKFGYILKNIYNQKKIPNIFIQTSKNKPDEYIINLIQKHLSSDWVYEHYNDEQIIDFFKNNYLDEFPNIIDRFNDIPLGQFKSDLFRYYYLYIKGGVYMDSDAMIYMNINKIIQNYEFFTVTSKLNEGTIFQGFIGAHAKHPIIYKALVNIYNLDNNLFKYYQIICKNMYDIINSNNNLNIKLFNEYNIDDKSYKTIDDDDKIILIHYFKDKIIPKN